MSRVGKNPVEIPKGVKAEIKEAVLHAEGPKGKLSVKLHSRMLFEIKDNKVFVKRQSDSKLDRSLHGVTRTLVFNTIKGVSEGFSKELEIQGVGFKAQTQGKSLILNLGFTHPIDHHIPEGIVIETPKPTQVVVKGADKQLVGEVAAQIRRYFKPEPYKGKGIRYVGEYVRRKVGKTVG